MNDRKRYPFSRKKEQDSRISIGCVAETSPENNVAKLLLSKAATDSITAIIINNPITTFIIMPPLIILYCK